MDFIPVPDVKMNDPLWVKQFILVRDTVLPYMWEILNDRVENAEKSHCIENFKIAAGNSNDTFYGPVFIDSDLYKWIEAVSYCLSVEENSTLEALCNSAIDLIEAAQQPDGYLNTYFTVAAPQNRWANIMEGHELYCAGHLIEAAVAHYQATGNEKLLNIACKFADLIDQTFGKGKRRCYPGHPEIELALIRLYQTTTQEKYLTLAAYFINERGSGEYIFAEEIKSPNHKFLFRDMAHFDADYFQAHLPLREQKTASGHAVRAMYLYSAVADLARLTHDPQLIKTSETLFKNIISRQMYITGGIGSADLGERFTVDFDLPSDSAYAETCASIGLMFFASRMWLINHDKTCFDIWEQALYNTVLSGMGQDGKHFFYVNPLEVVPNTIKHNPSLAHVKTQRQKWFGVACCPPNLARILTSLQGTIYAMEDNKLFVLSHIGSSFTKGGIYVNLNRIGSEYLLTIDGNPMEVFLRLPENSALISDQYQGDADGYFKINHPGGKQQYHYKLKPMVRVLKAHPFVSALSEKVCVQRGLSTYCVEGLDNIVPLSTLRLPTEAVFTEEKVDWLEEDMPVLKTLGFSISNKPWGDQLYDPQPYQYQPNEITLIPYSHWGNRGENEMRVWLNTKTDKSN